jgi:hypothetical protein
MPATIDQRLQALEQRAEIENERWELLKEHPKALTMIYAAIAGALSEDNPLLASKIVKYLQISEKDAVQQNAHTVILQVLRHALSFFQALAERKD